MKTKEQIQIEIEKLQKQLKELENKDYQEIKHKSKTFRIYKWENKPFKDFPMPKEFDWCKHFDFVNLINEEKVDLEKYPVEYYTKNQFKKNIKNGWELSRVCLRWVGYLISGDVVLASSSGGGRVVVVKT